MKFDATREKTRLWLLLLIGVVATLLGQTHAREIFAPSPHGSGIFATQTQASTGEIYDGIQYDAPDSSLAAKGTASIGPGLETRGLRPAPGTRVRPEGIPESWKVQPTKTGGGVQYVNPANTNQNVRVMQGNPNSPYPNSQAPYVRQQNAGGTYLRQDGTPSPLPKGGLHDGDAHIPLDQFQFRP